MRSTIRVGAESRGWKIVPQFVFADSTVVPGPTDATVWINVGTETGPGIVNFRAPGSGVRGSCECLIRQQSQVFGHVFDRRSSPAAPEGGGAPELKVTVVLGDKWKTDDAAAAWLLLELLRTGQLPRCARELAANMALSRQSARTFCPRASRADQSPLPGPQFLSGVLSGSDPSSVPPIPLYTAMLCRRQALIRAGSSREEVLDKAIKLVAAACMAIEHACARDGTIKLTPQDFDMALAPEWASEGPEPVLEDVRAAFAELALVADAVPDRFRIRLPLGESMKDDAEVECWFVDKSRVLDTLRQRQLSGKGKGDGEDIILQHAYTAGLLCGSSDDCAGTVVVMCASPKFEMFLALSGHRVADRESPSLRRLGIVLEEMEQSARAASGSTGDPRRTMRGRFADIPGIEDPWYDGRDHEYGIVSAPYAGSVLSESDIRETLRSAYWKPRLASARAWSVVDQVPSADGNPDSQLCSEGVYRPRQRVAAADDSVTWTYRDQGTAHGLRTAEYVVRSLLSAGACRADAARMLDSFPVVSGAPFRVLVLTLAPPPFAEATGAAEVADCVSEQVRDEFRRSFCGPASKTIELDADRVADVGPGGLVVWCRPGTRSDDPAMGLEMVHTCMDALAYRGDLHSLMERSSKTDLREGAIPFVYLLRRWWSGQSAGTYLIRFVDIVRSFRPEGAGADRRRICEALEDVLSVHSTVERLERFLQFSDERERILRDGMLEIFVVLLAVPVLFQTPADLLQAWSAWQDKGDKVPGVGEFWWHGIAGWIVLQSVLIVVGVLLLAGLLWGVRHLRTRLMGGNRRGRSPSA